MKASLAAIALAVSGAYAQGTLMVNTPPSAVVCQPLLITWTGGTPPYFLSILPGNQPGAAALVDFGTIASGNSHTWLVNLPANTQIGINLRDSTGALSQSAPFNINAGSDTACLNATTTSGSTTRPTTGSTTTTPATTTAPPTTTTTPATRPTTAPTTATATTNTAPTTGTTTGTGATPLNTNSAVGKLPQAVFAGIACAIAALLLA